MTRPQSRPEATAAHIQARADQGRAWQEIQELWEQGKKSREAYRGKDLENERVEHGVRSGCYCDSCHEKRVARWQRAKERKASGS